MIADIMVTAGKMLISPMMKVFWGQFFLFMNVVDELGWNEGGEHRG